jgi:glycosyltransferase involved in cell wall biosynthesis
VLSDSGSIPYVARVPDGVELVAQRDVTDLRLKIQNLLHNPSKRMKMGKLAREFVERQYSIQKIGKKYHEMLQQGM